MIATINKKRNEKMNICEDSGEFGWKHRALSTTSRRLPHCSALTQRARNVILTTASRTMRSNAIHNNN